MNTDLGTREYLLKYNIKTICAENGYHGLFDVTPNTSEC